MCVVCKVVLSVFLDLLISLSLMQFTIHCCVVLTVMNNGCIILAFEKYYPNVSQYVRAEIILIPILHKPQVKQCMYIHLAHIFLQVNVFIKSPDV